MTHWLDGITELFTCDTYDLAELAKVAGYNPEDFYRGTLPDDAIRRDVLKMAPPDHDGVFEFWGNLGSCFVNVPKGTKRRHTLRLHATVFPSVGALNRAFLTGELRQPSAAVVRFPSKFGAVENSSLLTPALEILASRGHPSALIADVQLIDQDSILVVAAGFRKPLFADDREDMIATGALVEFDFRRKTINIVSDVTRRLTKDNVVVSKEFAFQFGNTRSRPAFGPPLKGVLFDAQNIALIRAQLETLSERETVIANAYLRMFQHACLHISEELMRIRGRKAPQGNADIDQLAEHLLDCSRIAFNRSLFRVAEYGIELRLLLSRHFAIDQTDTHHAEALGLLADIAGIHRDSQKAIAMYKAALSVLDADAHVMEVSSTPNNLILDLQQRLATHYKAIADYQLAVATFGLAATRLEQMIEFGVEGVNVALLGDIYVELADLAESERDTRTAIQLVDDALEKYEAALHRQSSNELLAAIFGLLRRKVKLERRYGTSIGDFSTQLTTTVVGLMMFCSLGSRRYRSLATNELTRLLANLEEGILIPRENDGLAENLETILSQPEGLNTLTKQRAEQVLEGISQVWTPPPRLITEVSRALRSLEA